MFEHFEVYILDDFLLCPPCFDIMVETGCRIYFEDPILLWRLSNTAVHHEVHAAQAQSHVFGQLYGECPELRMHGVSHVHRIASGGEVRIIKKINALSSFRNGIERQTLPREV